MTSCAFGIPTECCQILQNGHCGITFNNFKISMKFEPFESLSAIYVELELEDFQCKIHSNFIVAKSTYVYTIFVSGHVNITGIKNAKEVEISAHNLCKIFNVNPPKPLYRLDNISASACLKKKINLRRLLSLPPANSEVTFNVEIFPGLYCRLSKCTIIIFSSGNIIIVGAKNMFTVHNCVHTFCTHIEQCGLLE